MRIGSGVALLPGLLLLLCGCSDSPKTEKAKELETPPEQPLTGRQAFQRMYPPARIWAPDAQPIQLRSINLQEVKAGKGKAGAWQAIFVSVGRGKSRSYTFSAVEAAGNLHQGVFAGLEEGWSAPQGQTLPFEIAAMKTDSDEAFKTAAAQSVGYVKKNPDKPVSFLLERTNRYADLAWRVVWGESVGTSDYSVFVDATTGKILETMH